MRNDSPLRVLVVEDDGRMLDLLCQGLREAGHTVMPAPDGNAAYDLASNFAFDVIVLDIGLPYRDGYEITRSLRANKRTAAILMLTARDAEDDIIRGLDLGADDYLIKPFSFPELMARIQALARMRPSRKPPTELVLDPARMTALRGNTSVLLTRTEFLLLLSLTNRAGEVVTRSQLMDAVWGKEYSSQSNNLEVFINSLRAKIDTPFQSSLIRTVRGIGYRFHCVRNSGFEELAG
jgi:DNA-binding response OmpR family regulator